MSGAPEPVAFEPHGERRRRQLIRAASQVIEADGVDAMRMPRVAEAAGCARSLVYHYFPTREDLFVAVVEHFYERLAERIDLDAQMAGMRSLHDREAARPLLEALWDTVQEVGSGGIILRASPRIGAELDDRLAAIAERFDRRWISALLDLELTALEAALAFRAAMAVHTELLERSRRGEVTRDEAIELGRRALAGVVNGLRTSP